VWHDERVSADDAGLVSIHNGSSGTYLPVKEK
jgi:hypothetical protein